MVGNGIDDLAVLVNHLICLGPAYDFTDRCCGQLMLPDLSRIPGFLSYFLVDIDLCLEPKYNGLNTRLNTSLLTPPC